MKGLSEGTPFARASTYRQTVLMKQFLFCMVGVGFLFSFVVVQLLLRSKVLLHCDSVSL